MASRDLVNNVKIVQAIVPGTYLTGTNPTSITVDTQGFESATLLVVAGEVTDAQTLTVKESANDDSYTDVADDDVIGGVGVLAAFKAIADDDGDEIKALGYIGGKRYLQVGSTGSGVAGATYGVIAILGNPQYAPVS